MLGVEGNEGEVAVLEQMLVLSQEPASSDPAAAAAHAKRKSKRQRCDLGMGVSAVAECVREEDEEDEEEEEGESEGEPGHSAASDEGFHVQPAQDSVGPVDFDTWCLGMGLESRGDLRIFHRGSNKEFWASFTLCGRARSSKLFAETTR